MVSPTIPIIRGLHHWPTYPPPRASSSRATLSALTEAARQRDEARPNLEATRTARGWPKKCGNKFLIVVDCGWFTGKIYRKNRDWTKKNLGKRWISLENVGLKPNKHLGQPVNDGWFTGKLWGLMQKNRSINWQQSTIGIEPTQISRNRDATSKYRDFSPHIQVIPVVT